MNSYIIDFIKTHPDYWEEIMTNHHIKVKRDGEYVIFNYDIMADFDHPVVREARGIIIHEPTLRVVCWPFEKFGNYGEPYAADIDWQTARVEEKVDGSIMKLWKHNGKWHVSTNGVIDAGKAECGHSGKTFADVFWEAAANSNLDITDLNPTNTYIFELIAPENRVVIDYGKEPKLYHIGTRNNATGLEYRIDIGVRKPQTYPLQTLEDCLNAVKSLNTGEIVTHEGFVVVDAKFRRVKIKSPEYLAIHHLLPNGQITDAQIVDAIKNNYVDDIIGYVPSEADRIEEWKHIIADAEQEIIDYIYWNRIEVEDNHLERGQWAKCHNKDKFFHFAVKEIFDDVHVPLLSLSTEKIIKLLKE